jgi:hypothetical protein
MGPFFCGRHEILRRLFVTVRDAQWREVTATEWKSELNLERQEVTITARHTSELVDFRWQGILHVGKEGREVRFALEGEVLRDMEVCRIGLALLYPVESLVGSRLTAIGPTGTEQRIVQPEIAPQPMIKGVPGAMTEPFAELAIEQVDGGTLRLELQGELFEIEDQRNWGDATFKTYCRPLRQGFPYRVRIGTVIAQGATLLFEPTIGVSAKSQIRRSGAAAACEQSKNRENPSTLAFPTVGREWGAMGANLDQDLAWHHLHVEVSAEEGPARLEQCLRLPLRSLIQVSLAVRREEAPREEIVRMLAQYRPRIARLLLCGLGRALPATRVVDAWRRELAARGVSDLPLSIQTRGHFVELNRGTALAMTAEGVGVAFPFSVTVHGEDSATILDNVAALGDMAQTARARLPCSHLALAPLALHYPEVSKVTFPRELVAPWTAAALIEAARAGIASVTLAKDLIDGVSATPEAAHRWLAEIIGYGGWAAESWEIPSSLPADVYVMKLCQRPGWLPRILAANLGCKPALVPLDIPRLTAVSARDLMTGAAVRPNADGIEIPPLAVVSVNS